ncbi:hypothetical protein GCM10009548_24160 [Streptomyces malaysiensis subsp. malaysiensis]
MRRTARFGRPPGSVHPSEKAGRSWGDGPARPRPEERRSTWAVRRPPRRRRAAGPGYTHAPGLSERARENRAIMIEALSSAGMVNYPTEWWHWSYGDRYWAWSTAAPAA